MSDNWTILIPRDPDFVPSPEAQREARRWLERVLPTADEITVEVTDRPEFVWAGPNFESASCPACRSDVTEWFWSALDETSESDFTRLDVSLPCCGVSSSLNDVECYLPQGFARFQLSAMNPNVGTLPADIVSEIARIVQSPMRVVYRHL